VADLQRRPERQHLVAASPGLDWQWPVDLLDWIDHAARGALDAQQRGDNRPFTRGNETLLCLRGDEVLANFDWVEPDEPGETMPLDDFFSLLAEWRSQVAQSASTATAPLPETYRRNPPSGPPGRRTRRGRSP
jgi:hypothetical protein